MLSSTDIYVITYPEIKKVQTFNLNYTLFFYFFYDEKNQIVLIASLAD